jgi:hypothetical protein
MPASYTTSLKLTLPADGDTNWGVVVNDGVTTLIDDSIANFSSIVLPVGSADRTLTNGDGTAPNEARRMFLKVTGTPSAATNIICPTASKLYFISNGTSPGFAVTLKTSVGTGISVPSGAKMVLYCDGTNVLDAITQLSSLTLANALAATSGGTGLSAAGTAGNVLTSNGTTWTSAAAAAAAAGSTTQVQYNNAGALAGSTNLTFDGTSLTVNGIKAGRGLNAVSTNTAVGSGALASSTGSAGFSTAFGYTALAAATSGGSNTAVGNGALLRLNTGSYNTAIGNSSGGYVTSGTDNTFVGEASGFSMSTGINNTAVGSNALNPNITGSNNVAIGKNSSLNSGDNNTCVGFQTGGSTGSNVTCLGYLAACSTSSVSNEITLGNSSVTVVRYYGTLTSVSDARDKTNIQPLRPGLNFINRLNPVSFDWNMRDGGKVGIADTGFIAQDLQSCQSLTQEFVPGLVYTENPDKLEASYGKLIPVLVKAIQELTARVAELESK